MARVYPFRGLRYALSGQELVSVVTPPYDVIDAQDQAGYYALHPHNIIRLELGQEYPGDGESDNRYTRAAATLGDWVQAGTLAVEDAPAFYRHEQEFELDGQRVVRSGFFAAVGLAPYAAGEVLPHEDTLARPIEDRLRLLQAARTNFSPIFGLYADPDRRVDGALAGALGGRQPEVEFTDQWGHLQRLWVVREAEALRTVQETMRELPIYIADGHHRYETALRYSQETGRGGVAEGLAGRAMMALVNLYDPGLIVLPTHRLVGGLGGLDLDSLLAAAGAFFRVEQVQLPGQQPEAFIQDELARRGGEGGTFALYGGGHRLYFLELQAGAEVPVPPGKSPQWARMDVPVLHKLILEQLLGIGAEKARNQQHLTYTRDLPGAMKSVDEGRFQLLCCLNPTPVDQVIGVAERGETMPQKSTFFYPKYITGLVLNPLDEGVYTR